MNKKFYTLVAGLLLASNVGSFAQTAPTATDGPLASAITTSLTQSPFGVSPLTGVTAGGKGYEVGVAYALGTSATQLLYVDDTKTLKFGDPSLISWSDQMEYTDRALWILQQIIPGDQNSSNLPKYVFVNKHTQTVLAFNTADVDKGVSELGGSQSEWLSAPSYTEPQTAANIYVSLGSDKVAVLAYNNATGEVSLVKSEAATIAAPAGYTLVSVVPNTISNAYWLSPRQLNTMMGKAGEEANAESFFTFSFSPEATMNGDANKLAVDLQAVGVMQAELRYGKAANAGGTGQAYSSTTNTNGYDVQAYSSLHPQTWRHHVTGAWVSTYEQLDDENYVSGYDATSAQWVALRNRDGKYLVVDTAYITGTSQGANKRVTFAWDDLYNLKKDSRYRDPRSYLFKVAYDPSTEEVKIYTYGYVLEPQATGHAGVDLATLYSNNGALQPVKEGQKWYAASTTVVTDDTKGTQVVNAALVNLNEATLGVEITTAPDNNKFTIKLGNSSAYIPTTIAPGAYLIQIVDDADKDLIGQYWANDLTGTFEAREQASRQNYQDMPSAQWIVESAGATAGSPITISSREFTYVEAQGTVYQAANGVFFANNPRQILKFIPVEDAKNPYLGYKYVADDTIKVSRFTFNYLHELLMDQPINTLSAKDSVVWVDKDGEAMEFVLVPAISALDNYGYNAGLSNVAQLKRMPYFIKVNDFSNVEDNARYLSYNSTLKKYVIGNDKTAFFLKENNEVEGGDCYYTLLHARFGKSVLSYTDYIVVSGDGSVANPFKETGTRTNNMIADNDLRGAFVATWGSVTNPETGTSSDTWRVQIWSTPPSVSPWYEVVEFPYTGSGQYAVRFANTVPLYSYYANAKVAVDNNTLNLTYSTLDDYRWAVVANSAFAAKKVDNPLYRRFNTALEGNEDGSDKPAVVNFYRVNATDKEYLYEDATSGYSKDLNFNFLGVEDKGVAGKNPAMYVDTAYVDRGDLNLKPQYMLVLNPEFVAGETNICDATNHAHATEEEAMACPHSSFTRDSLHGRFLINLKDSVDYHKNTALAAKYQWYQKYTRLGFVEATHVGDSLIIKNSVYTGNNKQINPKKETTWASKDTINLNSADHKSVTFSFRLLNNNSNDFLIESEGASAIAPLAGGWVKIQNGVPVIANGNYNEVGKDAEVFNVEVATTAPTANEAVAAEVSVVAAQGAIIVKGAAGKVVTVANILGQTIANQVAASDNVTIAAPAGVAVVTVDGEATKVIVK